jgi:hypothetical protein
MCPRHRACFVAYFFFIIRYRPEASLIHFLLHFGPCIQAKQTQKYIFINYADYPELRPFYGKAVALVNEPGR